MEKVCRISLLWRNPIPIYIVDMFVYKLLSVTSSLAFYGAATVHKIFICFEFFIYFSKIILTSE